MESKRLVELYYLYGKFNYGKAYYNLINKRVKITYENLKQEIELQLISNMCEDSLQLVKKR